MTNFIRLHPHIPSVFYDIITSTIILCIGFYLLLVPELFNSYPVIYKGFRLFSSQLYWSLFFIVCGFIGITITLLTNKHFYVHLFSRMLISFCLLVITFNNLLLIPPPLSTVTYIILSTASLIGICRTQSNG